MPIMSMILFVLVVALLYVVLPIAATRFFAIKGRRVITCPETRTLEGVEVDAWRAALSAALGGSALRLANCSRWPQRADCGQECLAEIERSPEDCLVRTILTRWYEGKSCLCCRKPFGPIVWSGHKPALMTTDRRSLEWSEIPAKDLRAALETHLPVCWSCHVVETLKRTHPELIVYRPWPQDRGTGTFPRVIH